MVLEQCPSPARSINGVSLFTKRGQPKSRYSRSEMLQILGATEQDFQTFLEIFAPRNPYYAIKREKYPEKPRWITAVGRQRNHLARLHDREVLRHLAGNQLPGRPVQWVAP